MSLAGIHAPGFPEREVRRRARLGWRALFPEADGASYGRTAWGEKREWGDEWTAIRLVPPVFTPNRLRKLVELGREPVFSDVDVATRLGGFAAPLPVYVSAFGSTRLVHGPLGVALARQAGALGLPMVLGENITTVHGFRRAAGPGPSLVDRADAYAQSLPPTSGGLVVQQNTEDADSELWNHVYSDPAFQALLASGRLGFELKLGQGAKPGLGGLTLIEAEDASRLSKRFHLFPSGAPGGQRLRASAPGTFTAEILRSQIRLMRNNYPRAKVWVKLPPTQDVAVAAKVAWHGGGDAVVVDGAEAGTGLAPTAFLDHVGLPLLECLQRLRAPAAGQLLVSGRFWEASRAVKAFAMGARAVGLGRAALLAVDEDVEHGLERFVEAFVTEMRMLLSALDCYLAGEVSRRDLWEYVAPLSSPSHHGDHEDKQEDAQGRTVG